MNNEEQDNQAISKIIQTLYKESVLGTKENIFLKLLSTILYSSKV